MDPDELIRAVVPLTFLAIWALTSLFNREAKPLPPRGGTAGGPLGPYAQPPRPQSAPQPWQPAQTGPAAGQKQPTMRWGGPAGGRPQVDDDILIIRDKPSQAFQRAKPARPQKSQRSREPKAHQAPATDIDSMKMESMTQNLTADLGKELQLDKLSAGVTSARAVGRNDERPATMAITTLLNSPERVREAFILKEILDPPVSLRGRVIRR
ncbi:hypothetical protein EP7_001335 [Isosphaeraceae bacterium EP7]